MNLEKMSPTEIKAAVYDELLKIEISQKNVQALNQELARRHGKPAPKSGPKK